MTQEQGYFIRPRMSIDRDFGIHRNAWVRDQRIVGNPLSIYLYLMSHDSNFRITLESARKGLGLGKDAFITARRTLEAAGYLRMVKVTHPAGAVDANGHSIGGRVLRYDIEVLDPEPASLGPTPEESRVTTPVDNSSSSRGGENQSRTKERQNPWSDPLTGFPVADEPVADHPLPDNPPLKENQEDQEDQSSSSTEVTPEATASDSETAALPPDDEEGDFGVDDSSSLVDDGLGACAPAGSSRRTSGLDASSGRGGEVEGGSLGGGEHQPVDLQRLLRAGIEVSLREVDARLDLSQVLRRLSDAGVDGERVDVPAAAA